MSSTGVLAVTFLLLVAGVVGSVVPAIPGAVLSILGVLYHWWATGYTTPGTLVLITFVGLGVVAMLVDLFGGAIAARHGGASKLTVVAAILVSIVLAIFTGPLAILIGVPVTVFLLELYRNEDRGAAGRAAIITTIGIFASALMQALLTLTMLIGFLLVIFV